MEWIKQASSGVAFRLAVAYEQYCILPVFERLDSLRAALLSKIPASTCTVLEVGPGPGFNVPHFPSSVTRLIALQPNDTPLHAYLERQADVRSTLRVDPVTYLTLPDALARGLLTRADADMVSTTAARVAAALHLPWSPTAAAAHMHDRAWVIPEPTGSVHALVGTLVLCTVTADELPWLLAEAARVLHPTQGRYWFLEHVPTRGLRAWGPLAWVWQVLRRAHASVFGGCDIGRARTLAGMAAALEVEGTEWEDGRWWAAWIFGKFVYGSGRAAGRNHG